MPSILQLEEAGGPPTNIAQLGMGWNLITGTIDLGLGIYDAVILLKEWLYQRTRNKAKEKEEEEMRRRGRKDLLSEPAERLSGHLRHTSRKK
jgi:hypothetical protein